MKISKVSMLTIGGLLALCTVSLIAEAAPVSINQNLTNAIQHISSIGFIKSGSEIVTAEMRFLGNKGTTVVAIDTNNFLLSKEGSNTMKNSTGSSILGGLGNTINKGSGSVIVAGSGNMLTGSNSVIRGGVSNKILTGDSLVIIGGENNTISKGRYSTIVGGHNNTIAGSGSIIAGNNSTVSGNNSVALGSGVEVIGNNSFLWSDKRKALTGNGKFVVISDHGMVVNTNAAATGAQLTIGGPIIISEGANDGSAVCSGGKGAGLIKLVKEGNNDRGCLCTCNGKTRNSIYRGGTCKTTCNGSAVPEPKCDTGAVQLTPDGKTYTGGCEEGSVVDQTYYVDSKDGIHRACQTLAGVTGCSIEGKVFEGPKNDPDGSEFSCTGGYIPTTGAYLVPKSNENLTENTPNALYNDEAAASGHKCAYLCKQDYKYNPENGGKCEKIETEGSNGCTGDVPANADLVTGSEDNVQGLIERKVYENKEAAGSYKCAYICKGGYNYVKINGEAKCARCKQGTYKEDTHTCVMLGDCPNGRSLVYNETINEWECEIDGGCRRHYNTNVSWGKNRDYWHASESREDVHPLGGSNLEFGCQDDKNKVKKNQCQFSCEEGYSCKGSYSCEKNECRYGISIHFQGEDYYNGISIERAEMSAGKIGWMKRQQNPQNYNNPFTFVEDESDIDTYIGDNTQGCYYRCEEAYRKYTVDGSFLGCSDGSQKNEEDEEDDLGQVSYMCQFSGFDVRGDAVRRISNPVEGFTQYEYLDKTSFDKLSRNTTGCYYTCETGDIQQRNGIYLCWHACEDGLYMNAYGYCTKCPEGYTLDMNKTETINNITNVIDCKQSECPKDFQRRNGECIATTADVLCPSGSTLCKGLCYVCLDSSMTLNQDTCVCE